MKKVTLLLMLLISLSSCSRLMFEIFRPRKAEMKVLKNEEKGRSVVFIPTIHIAKPGYFSEIKSYVDSLKQNGYVLYYEGIGLSKEIDSSSVDTLVRKFRKIMGKNVFGGYTNKENKSLPKYLKNKKFVMQNNENTGVTEEDYRIDLNLDELLGRYEEKYGKIELEECDFNTGLYEKYKCEIIEGEFEVTNTFRDEYITEQVLKSEHEKIILLYGKMHYFMIYPNLMKEGFTLVE